MKYTKTIRASKKVATRPVRASRAALRRRAIKADVDFEDVPVDEEPIDDMPAEDIDLPAEGDGEAEVTVDDAATELLFEAEDVAELVSEVTGLPVDVTVDEDEVVFAVGDDEYTVTPEGDEEIVEQSTRMRKSARRVAASRRMARPARKVSASRRAHR
jgi:hypothetical protein